MGNNKNSQKIKVIMERLKSLLAKAKKIHKEIDRQNATINKDLKEINKGINTSVNKIGSLCSDLDQIEKEAGDELDKFILEQAENLVKE